MEKFIANGTSFLEWLQMPSAIIAAIILVIAGYFWKVGGQDGRRIAKSMLIGIAVGLVLINGALALVTSFNSNISF